MPKKPSDRILEINNSLKLLDNKEADGSLSSYNSIAIQKFLDENFEYMQVPGTTGYQLVIKKITRM